jgi:hypothetical protein
MLTLRLMPMPMSEDIVNPVLSRFERELEDVVGKSYLSLGLVIAFDDDGGDAMT